jgi:hypothetical protein
MKNIFTGRKLETEKDIDVEHILRVSMNMDHVYVGNLILQNREEVMNLKYKDEYKDFDVIEYINRDKEQENKVMFEDFSLKLKGYIYDVDSISDDFSDEESKSSLYPQNKSKDSRMSAMSPSSLSRNPDNLSKITPKSFNVSSVVKNMFNVYKSTSDKKPPIIETESSETQTAQLKEEFLAILKYKSENTEIATMRYLKQFIHKTLEKKHQRLAYLNSMLSHMHCLVKQKKEFLEFYLVNARVSIDGCKRERYLLKIKEMDAEIKQIYV